MTDPTQNSQDYWYIRIPKSRCSKPNFHFFQQLGFHWEDDDGNHYYDIGEVIAIKYVAKGDESGEWYYQMRYLRCTFDPSLNGEEDECFEAESRLVADNTILEEDG